VYTIINYQEAKGNMQIEEIQATDVRKGFADMLNRVAFSNAQYRINRHNKRIARLVPETLMQALETLLETDDGLTETLELMVNGDLLAEIEESIQQSEVGEVRPIADIFSELE
jgi:antitoxin (DNA-binding transcriptional repressor) of toxin-antitoxin stability system